MEENNIDTSVLVESNSTPTDTQDSNIVKKSKRGNAPSGDYDLIAVLNALKAKWIEEDLRMRWITKQEVIQKQIMFEDLLFNRNTVGASRRTITGGLSKLDKEIDTKIEHVKNRLAEQLGSKAEARKVYVQFGIMTEKTLKLPKPREVRVNSFDILLNGLKLYGMEDITFGTAYWTDIRNQYKAFTSQARSTDGNVSSKISDLEPLRKELKQFCNSFILLIRVNYPDTWKLVIRDYGFQREKY